MCGAHGEPMDSRRRHFQKTEDARPRQWATGGQTLGDRAHGLELFTSLAVIWMPRKMLDQCLHICQTSRLQKWRPAFRLLHDHPPYLDDRLEVTLR
jgi:hypothetical protein